MHSDHGDPLDYYLGQNLDSLPRVPAPMISPAAATVMMTIRFILITSRCGGCYAMNPHYSLFSGCDCRAYRTRPCVRYSWRIYHHFRWGKPSRS